MSTLDLWNWQPEPSAEPAAPRAPKRAAQTMGTQRETWPDGRWKPLAGERVYRMVPGIMGAAVAQGVAETTRRGDVKIRAQGKLHPATEAWSVHGDPVVAQRDAERAALNALDKNSKRATIEAARQEVLAEASRRGLRPLTDLAQIGPGSRVFGITSAGRYGDGDPAQIKVNAVTVKAVMPREALFLFDVAMPAEGGGTFASEQGGSVEGGWWIEAAPAAPRARRQLPVIQPRTRRRLKVVQPESLPEFDLPARLRPVAPALPMPPPAPAPPPKAVCKWKLTVKWDGAQWVAEGDTYNAKNDLRTAGFSPRPLGGGRWSWVTSSPATAAKLRDCMTAKAAEELDARMARGDQGTPKAAPTPAVALVAEGKRFVVRGDTRGMNLKDAGFRSEWRRGARADGGDLFDYWWTDRPEVAVSLAAYATPETAEILRGEIARRDRDLAASRAATEADIGNIRPGFTCAQIPVPPGLSYLPYQCAGIAYAAEREGTLIGDDMGLGKTVQAIGVMNADPSIRATLIVCPASLRENWRRHLVKWLVRPARIYVVRDGGTIPPEAEVVIFSFQGTIARGADEMPAAYRDAMARTWDLLVVDEAHFLKNPKAKRTAAILGFEEGKGAQRTFRPGLAQRARRRLFLTGTPLPNRPVELWPILHALNPAEFNNFFAYAKRYCAAHKKQAGRMEVWDFSGSSNELELQERMRRTLMIRRMKMDVLKDLPPKRRIVIPLDPEIGRPVLERLANRAFQEYLRREAANGIDDQPIIESPEQLIEMWMEELNATAGRLRGKRPDLGDAAGELGPRVKVAFDEVSRIREELAIAKAPHVAEFVTGILSERPKVVVMAHHRKVQDALVKAFTKLLGAEAVVLHRGGMPDAEKTAAEVSFQTDPKVRVFVGSIMASGVGITLTAADTLVMAEIDWVPGNNAQAEDRIHRIGQTLPATIYYLVIDGTIDAQLVQTCVRKLDVADKVLNQDTRDALMRDPITAPMRREAETPLEVWALGVLGTLAGLPANARGVNPREHVFAQRTIADPRLTDKGWRYAVAIAVRFTGGSMKRVDASLHGGNPPRPAQNELEAWAASAMLSLSEADSDRAVERNGVGFSKGDSYEGHALAALISAESMTESDWRSAVTLARRYRRQVGAPPVIEPPRMNPRRTVRRATPPMRRRR
jgi:hypothetical protein